ncbi:hypothetical protein B7463_g9638, partial [Scytalidium lignicola]
METKDAKTEIRWQPTITTKEWLELLRLPVAYNTRRRYLLTGKPPLFFLGASLRKIPPYRRRRQSSLSWTDTSDVSTMASPLGSPRFPIDRSNASHMESNVAGRVNFWLREQEEKRKRELEIKREERRRRRKRSSRIGSAKRRASCKNRKRDARGLFAVVDKD